jgi:hypothetical protein
MIKEMYIRENEEQTVKAMLLRRGYRTQGHAARRTLYAKGNDLIMVITIACPMHYRDA